ncbi:Uncharacterised protein [Mycobacteroides abscessus subsp. abscessus]|nr:Uncharacterised protein [Mycobacteroides abscessus subsp. abscessus]
MEHDASVGQFVGQIHNGQLLGLDRISHHLRTLQQLGAGLLDMTGLELIDPRQPVLAPAQDRGHHPHHQIPDISTRNLTGIQRIERGPHRTTGVMTQDRDQRHPQDRHRILNRTEHGRVDHLTGSTHDEHIAQTLIENDLRSHPAIRAPEQHDLRVLTIGQLRPPRNALTRMLRKTPDKTLVTLFECRPGGLRIRCLISFIPYQGMASM